MSSQMDQTSMSTIDLDNQFDISGDVNGDPPPPPPPPHPFVQQPFTVMAPQRQHVGPMQPGPLYRQAAFYRQVQNQPIVPHVLNAAATGDPAAPPQPYNNVPAQQIQNLPLFGYLPDGQALYLLPAPTTVKTKPTTVKTDPTTVKTKPTTVKTDPTTVKTKPTSVKTKPTSVKTKPTTVKTKPTTVKTDPTTVKTKPTTVKTKPTSVKTKPTSVKTKPTSVKTKPTTVKTKPTTVKTKPTSVKTKPTTVKTKPTSVETDDGSYIKKPPNAFILFMKEQRPNYAAKMTTSGCRGVNVILGQKWKSLSADEQAKYYEQADEEKRRHAQCHPYWTLADNYGVKRKRVRSKASRLAAKLTQTSTSGEVTQQKPRVASVVEAPPTNTFVPKPPNLQTTPLLSPDTEVLAGAALDTGEPGTFS